ncbi:MAG: TetR/AcrR family transcriptional regulator [Bacillota bacterium]|nr:TetR/AcrR family transcriptional regulator [Bacillota bacterium]
MLSKEEIVQKARSIFAKKGYKNTAITEITEALSIATGSFYKYFPSKEELFLEVYILENDRVRSSIVEQVDWKKPMEALIEDLFSVTNRHLFGNKIMAEWSNPKISKVLHRYYDSEQGRAENRFHQFLSSLLEEKMRELELEEHVLQKLKRVYEFMYFVDCHITEADFEGYNEVIQFLLLYFVKGILSERREKKND